MMLSLLLFCLIIILTVESKKKDKISAQVGNDGSIRNVRKLLQGSGANGYLDVIQYPKPAIGEYVSYQDPQDPDNIATAKVIDVGIDNTLTVQRCMGDECMGPVNHLDKAITMTSDVHVNMTGCSWDAHGNQVDNEGDDPAVCVFDEEATSISFSNPGIDKVTCNCPLSCYGQDTFWGASYPIAEAHGMTISFASDDAQDQINFAKVIKDETASDPETHEGRRVILAHFCDPENDEYFDARFPSTGTSQDDFTTVIKLTDDDDSPANIFWLAQKATAKGMFYAQQGFDVITMALCANKLVEALDANGGGAHFYEFNKLLDRSGCYGDQNKHTVILMYHEEDDEVTGNEQRRFAPTPHIRFAPGLCGSVNDMNIDYSLSRQVMTKYLCNDKCDEPANVLEDIDVAAYSMIGVLADLEYDTTAFCNENGSWNQEEIDIACNDDQLTPSNTCGYNGEELIQSEEDQSICDRLIKYICGREALSTFTASIRDAHTLATDQGLGECPAENSIYEEFEEEGDTTEA